jgi:hypothetical protein
VVINQDVLATAAKPVFVYAKPARDERAG